jgi:hypothetical protein
MTIEHTVVSLVDWTPWCDQAGRTNQFPQTLTERLKKFKTMNIPFPHFGNRPIAVWAEILGGYLHQPVLNSSKIPRINN